uniref:mobilization protein MbpB n=3 Tax=Bacteria TaxID=2 RepID=UPI003F651841
EVRRNEKITFRCSALEKAALSEQAARCGLSTSEYCRSLSLGGRPRERYTEEERELLRDIARLKGTLQRLNNYFGGRQYREVFEENRTLITELQKNTLTMIGKGKSISHGVAALEYDLAKEINGQAVATEIARHELYGCTGAEMVQEMKPYHIDFPNVKNNCLRFEVSPSIEESSSFTDTDWAELGNDFMQRMGLMNHQYIIIKHSGTESKKKQAHLHILANRISLSGELYRDNWIGKRATEAANAIAKERDFVQSQDIGKANKAEIKEAMDGVLKKMQGFDFTKFKEELGKRGFKVREARASTGKLNGYYVTARSGTEYKASEIGKGYTLAHIERTQSKLKCNSMNISHGNKLTPGSGSFQR